MKNIFTDSFDRTINYLRLSITDRCNLRCLYCMPSKGITKLAHKDILRFEELLRICGILSNMGISTVRITGGEPLVRKGASGFIKELKCLSGIKRVNMTTNGVLLGEYVQSLAASGLDAVNVSLDTLDEEKFSRLTRGGSLKSILPAIDRALDMGLEVKINCVPMHGFNEEELVRFASLARDKNIAVRFIELMPLGVAAELKPLPINEAAFIIEKTYGTLTAAKEKSGSGPAVYYTLPGFSGRIGIIGAVSRRFCEKCNRIRITADGTLKLCLAHDLGINIRELLRGETSDEEIEEAIRNLARKKPAGHNFDSSRLGTNEAAHEKAKLRKTEMVRIGG